MSDRSELKTRSQVLSTYSSPLRQPMANVVWIYAEMITDVLEGKKPIPILRREPHRHFPK